MALSGKEIDVLLHLELQNSMKYREEIEKELQEIVTTIDNYEIYKAKVAMSTEKSTYQEFTQAGLLEGKSKEPEIIQERRESMKRQEKYTSQVPVINPHFVNTSTVLNKLRQLDL